MSFFRSEKMTLCQMLLHKESAFDCLAELGTLGTVQFNNLNDAEHQANLQFVNEVQRCNEVQRMLQHLITEIGECGMTVVYYPDVDEEMPQAKDLKEIELAVHALYQELTDVEHNYDGLQRQKNRLLEKWHVLTKAGEFLQGDRNTEHVMAWSDSVMMTVLRDETRHVEGDHQLKLGFFTGSIPIERFHGFEVMLWRLCRGNFFMRHAEIPEPLEDPHRGNVLVPKLAFVLVFQGDAMRQKITKVCQGFRVNLFECPESRDDRVEKRKGLATDMEDLKLILEQTDDHRRRVLIIAAADIYIWKVKVKKILMIYFVLNRLAVVEQLDNQKYLQASCWIPTAEIPAVRAALLRGARRASKGEAGMIFPPILSEKKSSEHEKTPPTFFRLNRFTRGFQNLIDAYGVAVYQELNPAPYTIVTFPFLFAVMFGDIGHGLIMALFGLWMVVKEVPLEKKRDADRKQNEIWNILFAGRYVILLMGLFSIYTGLIYNDIFSKSFNFFGSKWTVHYTASTVANSKHLQLDPARLEFYQGQPYIFGMDPVWDASGENAIITFNSLKMKLAIILGVTQMLFGLGLSAWNHIHLKNPTDLYLVCVPQIVFLLCLFFYLVFLIFYKWVTYGGHNDEPYNSACAPSILITFIDMILMKGNSVAPEDCDDQMYSGQNLLEKILVFTAFFCVPVLLAGKPLHFMLQKRKIKRLKNTDEKITLKRNTLTNVRKSLVYNVEYNDEMAETSVHAKSEDVDMVDMGELWIHQGIHCIESVLGSVSHTASYLRLWALSLAHDQLSTVLWNMVLAHSLTTSGGLGRSITLYLSFWFWAILTVAILVVMEGLSAFLHTLRLHWVEFQSKFYAGSGELFCPFRFEKSTING